MSADQPDQEKSSKDAGSPAVPASAPSSGAGTAKARQETEPASAKKPAKKAANDKAEAKPAPKPAKSSGGLGFGGVLLVLIAGFGGGLAAYFTAPLLGLTEPESAGPGFDPAPLDARIARLETARQTLADRIDALPEPDRADLDPVYAEIDALAGRLGALEEQAPTADVNALAADTAALVDVAERLIAVEDAVEALQAARGSEAGLASADSATDPAQLQALEARLAALEAQASSQESDRSASADAVDALASTVDALDERLRALATAQAESRSPRDPARAVQPVVAAARLLTRLRDGAPYQAEWRILRAAAPEITDAAPALLSREANAGIASLTTLQNRFEPLPARLKRAWLNAQEGWWNRFLARLSLLFVVRRTEFDGSEASLTIDARLARAEQALAEHDLDQAVALIAALEPAVRRPAEGWLADARTRLTALEAASMLFDRVADGPGAS